jgi:hypothetical protein
MTLDDVVTKTALTMGVLDHYGRVGLDVRTELALLPVADRLGLIGFMSS